MFFYQEYIGRSENPSPTKIGKVHLYFTGGPVEPGLMCRWVVSGLILYLMIA